MLTQFMEYFSQKAPVFYFAMAAALMVIQRHSKEQAFTSQISVLSISFFMGLGLTDYFTEKLGVAEEAVLFVLMVFGFTVIQFALSVLADKEAMQEIFNNWLKGKIGGKDEK